VQIEVTSRHGTVSDDVRRYIVQKSEKILTFFERVTAIQVTVDFENTHLIKVEMLVDAEHKHDFVANDVGQDVISTFDRTLHKMEQQVRKYKERIQDHRRDRPTGEYFSTELDSETQAGDAVDTES